MMHPALARAALGLPARPGLFTLATGGDRPGRVVRVGDLVEMANGWVSQPTKKGGVKAVHEATGRVVYGERARRLLEGGGRQPRGGAGGRKAAGKKAAEAAGGGNAADGWPQKKPPSPDEIERVEKEGLTEDEAAEFDAMVADMPWKDLHGVADRMLGRDGSEPIDPKALKVLAKHMGVSTRGGREATVKRVVAAAAKKKVESLADRRPREEERARKATREEVARLPDDLASAIADGEHGKVADMAAVLGIVPSPDPKKNARAIVARVKALRRQPRKPKEGAAKKPPTKADIDAIIGTLGG